jgi:two-component system cell cycle sensor histidine kinase/response regulator CckA
MQEPGVEILWVLAVASLLLLFFSAAYIFVTVKSHREIVEAQRAQFDDVSRSERKYRGLFENCWAGIMTFDVDNWAVVNSNRAMWRIFGCESQDEFQKSLAKFPASAILQIKGSLLHDYSVDRLEIETTRMDGEILWIQFSAEITSEDRRAQAVVVDMTERKHSGEKIREQSSLLDQTQDAILLIDFDGRVKYWNGGAAQTYGWKNEDALDRQFADLFCEGANNENFTSPMEDIIRFNKWRGEQHHKRKDGKEILVESRWKVVERSNHGRSLVMIVNSDITEKRKLELQAVRAQRMESIAVLTGGLAHDLHNILAPLSLSIHILQKRLSGKSSLAILRAIEEPVQSGVELVKNILTYGKGISGDRVRIRIEDVLSPALEKVTSDSCGNIRLVRHFDGQKMSVLGDSTQLRQVFLNLCVNARDAMPDGGTLTAKAVDFETNTSLLDLFPSAEAGPYVEISISDTGRGIPAEDLERIFEPFFTTKGGIGGTGLGLSVVHGIVTSHRGYVVAESLVGEGSTFRIFLPAVVDRTN